MLLSIIIPVYNVKLYLKECLDSIINNDLDDFEIILVNDGSNDGSEIICNKYAEQYSYIRVIHQKNGGLSSARNTGIRNAIGEYIIFLDSDDYINKNKLIDILDMLNKLDTDIDVIMSNFCEIRQKQKKITKEIKKIKKNKILINNDELIKNIFLETEGLWTAWKFIVRRRFLKKHNIWFKEGFLHEDVDYTTRVLISMENFMYYPIPWYCYRLEREGSIMNNKKFKSLKDTANIVNDLNNFINSNNWSKETKDVILSKLSETIYSNLKLYKYGTSLEKKEFINLVKKNKFMLYKSRYFKHKIFYKFTKIFGIQKTIELYIKI